MVQCTTTDCEKEGTMQCPTCVKMKIDDSWFCSQDCFRAFWKTHNQVHKEAKQRIRMQRAREAFRVPDFNYTGELRPHFVTPMREVPPEIPRPDYADDGVPTSELAVKRSTKIDIKTPHEIELMRDICRIGREVLDLAGQAVAPGVTTEEIDIVVHNACIERGAYPSPLNYHYFPKACCTSVNEIICHGIPDDRPLQDGDIVNIDISVYKNGHHGDLNETFLVGEVEQQYKDLIKTTYESTMESIATVKPGVWVRDFGKTITKVVSKSGYSVVRSYCGHGIGKLFHSAPNVPHYAKNKAVGILKPGMTFTIEPMINMGGWRDVTWPDNWTSATIDGKRSAQFEHTVLVTETGVDILTARTDKSVPFWWEDSSTNKKAAAADSASSSSTTSASKKKRNKRRKKKAGQEASASQTNGTPGSDVAASSSDPLANGASESSEQKAESG